MSDARRPTPSNGDSPTEPEADDAAPSWGFADADEAPLTAAAETESLGPAAVPAQSRARGDSPPVAGDRIGRFTVLEVLGRGGMGVVVSAYDPLLDRRVAIKLVSARVAKGASYHGRLLREARAMAKLRHPNVVVVHEVGEHEGQVYVAMEQVDGGTLRSALAEREGAGEGDWRRVLAYFVQAGRGLAAAHAQGMVHRDFKTDNVFVDPSDRVLVGDFGLVSAIQSPASGDVEDARADEALTHADERVGTPSYMAPEQYGGQAVDARADQFGFCVALYEALYGTLPFAGARHHAYLSAIVRGEVVPPTPGRNVPTWLREVLLRGLSADPRRRYPSMDALLAELGADPKRAYRLGRRTRIQLAGVGAAFACGWFVAVLGFDLELSYRLHYATSAGFLAAMLGMAWIGRRAFARTAFNRAILGAGLAVAIILVALVSGGSLLALSPRTVGVLHLLVVGGTALGVSASMRLRKLVAVAAVYLIGFLFAAARPPLLFPILLVAHATAAVGFYALVATR